MTALVLVVPPAYGDHCLVGECHQSSDTGQSPQPQPEAQPRQATNAPSAATELARLLNDERARHGLAPFHLHDDATAVARDHSLAMASEQRLYHNDAWFSPANRQRLGAGRLAENVAMNPDPADAHRRLMASAGHRANILDPKLTHVGVAAASDGDGTYYFTQGFFTPKAAPAPAPAPAPVATKAKAPKAPAAPAPVPSADAAPAPAVVDDTTSDDTSVETVDLAGPRDPAMLDASRSTELARSPHGLAVTALALLSTVIAVALRTLPRLSSRD